MKYVIHKFQLPETTQRINLEADAVVLYADRDSREDRVAIWVRRRCDWREQPATVRTFRTVGTGEPYDVPVQQGEARPSEHGGGVTMYGPVRIGEFIFHVFEVKP